jgi:hypothetical protein
MVVHKEIRLPSGRAQTSLCKGHGIMAECYDIAACFSTSSSRNLPRNATNSVLTSSLVHGLYFHT